MDINDLRRARKKAADDMKAKADALAALENQAEAASESDMTAAMEAFGAAETEFKKLDGQVKRAEASEAAVLVAATPEPSAGETGGDAGGNTPAVVAEPGLRFGAALRVLGCAGGNFQVAQQIAEAEGQSGLFAASQNVSEGVQGGFLVPEDVSEEVIELLRPETILGQMGIVHMPMPNGNFSQNRRTKGANFGYGGEGQDIKVTGVGFGQLKLSAKKMSGIIPISNDLLSMAGTAVDRLILNDALEDAAVAQDRHFLRSTGSDFAPKGLRWQLVGTPLEARNILNAGALAAALDERVQQIKNWLGRVELALTYGNVDQLGAQWILSPRVAQFLQDLVDGNGNKVFPEMENGTLRRKKFHVTTLFPDNLGVGGNEAEIMLVHPRHVVVGEHNGVKIAMSGDAAYVDESGETQSAFSRDETLLRMIMHHDIGLRQLAGVAVLKEVKWGDE